MKTTARKICAVYPILVLLIAGVSMNSFASSQNNTGNLDHKTLAAQHESLAKEMQAKVNEQKNILKNKPRSSHFGRNGQRIKSRVASRIHKYEQAATTHLAKADYHLAVAAKQTDQHTAAKPGQANEQINKAKKKLSTDKSI